MNNRPIIYVSRITNLSDARYCAGMGANLLGFIADPGNPDYITPTQFKEIMGWVSGPSKVIELKGDSLLNIQNIVESYAPDFIHIELSDLNHIEILAASIPFILSVDEATVTSLNSVVQVNGNRIAYFIISQEESQSLIETLSSYRIPVLMAIGKETKTISDLQEKTGVNGFVMQGSAEAKPGLKDYDHLSTILEALDY